MIRIIALAAVLAPAAAYSQLNDTYYFSPSANCTIKEYKSGGLTQVDAKNFQGVPLKAKKLNRNPQFMAYKVAGKIYISPATCLKTTSLDSLEELETDSFDERGRRDQTDYGNRLNAADNGQRKSSNTSASSSFKNNYYLELDMGILSSGAKNPTYPDYSDLNQVIVDGADTTTINFGEAESSSYKTGAAISVGLGKRISPIQFLSFKFRKYSGNSTDSVPVTMTYSDGSPTDEGTANLKFEDSVMDFMLGTKFVLMPDSNYKPILAAYLGLSTTSSKIIDLDGNQDETKTSSSAMVFALEGGLETMFSENFGVGATLGYQYVSKRKYKFDQESDTQALKPFTSNKSYSNLSLSLGIKTYF